MKKIVVTGGAGFLGRHVVEELLKKGASESSIFIPRSKASDLRTPSVAHEVCKNADLVIHLAAKVGGIGFNRKFPGDLFFDNAIMGINLIEASRVQKVKKILVAGTICAYPNETPVPFKEENLWNGFPEITNAPYGIAKKSLAVMLQAYREQYSLNGLFILPVNLYGPWDNFHLEHAHVIPALIRKFIEAKNNNNSSVTLWGDGSPTREFLFVKDAARGLVMAAESFDSSEPVNLGSAEEISIRDLANLIQKKIGYRGEVIWDSAYPNGQMRRKLDTVKAQKYFNFRSEVTLDKGLEETIQWWSHVGSVQAI
ncbi:MAG: GDP-L-fucose synthase [Oligoflexia bacterium]|nr:GDP-L-fucose synthase [Oligoflexia bacterium]